MGVLDSGFGAPDDSTIQTGLPGGGPAGISPDLIAKLGAASANPEKLAALKKQMAMADYARQGPEMPQGHYIPGMHGAGVYVAPNALQSLGAGAQYAIGAKMGMDALNKENTMASDEASNRTAIMRMLAQAQQNPGEGSGADGGGSDAALAQMLGYK